MWGRTHKISRCGCEAGRFKLAHEEDVCKVSINAYSLLLLFIVHPWLRSLIEPVYPCELLPFNADGCSTDPHLYQMRLQKPLPAVDILHSVRVYHTLIEAYHIYNRFWSPPVVLKSLIWTHYLTSYKTTHRGAAHCSNHDVPSVEYRDRSSHDTHLELKSRKTVYRYAFG